MTRSEVIFNTINKLKPPNKWTEKEVSDFKTIYFRQTGKIIDSLNPSYPFSSFLENNAYRIGSTPVDMSNLNQYQKASNEYTALMKQWQTMTFRKEFKYDPKGTVEPLYSDFAEKVASEIEKLDVNYTGQSPPISSQEAFKRQRLTYSKSFRAAILLIHNNKAASAFETFLKNQMPKKGGKPDGLIVQLPNISRPVDLKYIDTQLVESASDFLRSLAQSYYDESCKLKLSVQDDIEQYKTYMRGARVKPNLTASQYEKNANNIDKGYLLQSKLAILRRSLFKSWQSFAKEKTDTYLEALKKFNNAVVQYDNPEAVGVLVKKIPAALPNNCIAKLQAEARQRKLASSKYKQQQRKKGRKQVKDERDKMMRRAALSALPQNGQPSNNKLCQQWYDVVVDMYKNKFKGNQFKITDASTLVAEPKGSLEVVIAYTFNNQTKRLTINAGTNVATDQFIDRLLTKETDGIRCSKEDTLFLNTLRNNKKREIKSILKTEGDKVVAAKQRAERDRLRKIAKPNVPPPPPDPPAPSIAVPKAPEKNPWEKNKDKPIVNPMQAPMQKAPAADNSVSQAKVDSLQVKKPKKPKKIGGRGKKKAKEPAKPTQSAEPSSVIEVTNKGKYQSGQKGAFLLTSDFALNGSFYLENPTKAQANNVDTSKMVLYKNKDAQQGDYVLRYSTTSSGRKSSEDLEAMWDKKSVFTYKNKEIELSYNGKTYRIKDDDGVMFKSASEKRPLTFIGLEPNAKAESFTDGERRKRLQNRVQISYDSMSEDDILEIEKAMQEYDDTLEKAVSEYDSSSDVSMDKASYDSSSNASNAKSYDSSSDVSMDKASYDSHSEDEKTLRVPYDSSSEVASETEMDYSYDSSSGVEEEDGNVPYDSDN